MNHGNLGGAGKVTHPALRSENRGDKYELAPVVSVGDVPAVPEDWSERFTPEQCALGVEVWEAVWSFGGTAYTPENDYILISRYVEMHIRRKVFIDQIEQDGWVIPGQKGEPRIHPASGPLERLEKTMFDIEKEIGLTVSARIRLGLLKLEEEDEFEKWEKKNNA